MNPVVRKAEYGDLCDLLELYTHLHEPSVPERDERLERVWDDILRTKGYSVLVAEENGRIVSSCTLMILPNLTQGQRPYALIENVVTHAAFRGRGFARACMDEARRLAKEAGCYKIMLLTGSKDEATLRFYQSCGYNSSDKTGFVQWL